MDFNYITQWRPLCLLNCDKILAKVLAHHMKGVLTDLISEDQTGFMKGRCISCHIRRLLNVMQNADDESIPAIILSLDLKSI